MDGIQSLEYDDYRVDLFVSTQEEKNQHRPTRKKRKVKLPGNFYAYCMIGKFDSFVLNVFHSSGHMSNL